MARFYEPTDEQKAGWAAWVAERPDIVRKICERLDPWTLYRMKPNGERVTFVSCNEDGTIKVDISADFNLTLFERQVFGVNPDDLEECDLPAEGEPAGEMLAPAEQTAFINARRAENGLAPLGAGDDAAESKLASTERPEGTSNSPLPDAPKQEQT